MDRETLVRMLSEDIPIVERTDILRNHYFPCFIERFNVDRERRRLGLYQGERIPENERNLADVRNRVSLIIEYELARISNQILDELGVDGFFWSYVVANRFPDLEVRRIDGSRCLRIEVKCLQSIAEEKSANFDTLIKDIHPNTDFVVVFLWEWTYGDGIWDRAPKILNTYTFHAHSLARLRDTYWLNRPHAKQGDGYQGFDIRYAVNCTEGVYSVEEGNYGKLLRIWQEDFPYRPAETPELLDTETEYFRFKSCVILEGFNHLCNYHLSRMSPGPIEDIAEEGRYLGKKSENLAFLLGSQIRGRTKIASLMRRHHLRYVVTMTEKYVCKGYALQNGKLVSVFDGLKPKELHAERFSQTGS